MITRFEQDGWWPDDWWNGLWQWAEANGELLAWLFVGSIVSLVLCAMLLPVLVLRMPADYFASSRDVQESPKTALAWIGRIGKNLLGAVFLLAGIAMLVLPGQGVLTILIGLMLLDFPGKRGLERRVVSRPKILSLLNRMRKKRDLPPLIVD